MAAVDPFSLSLTLSILAAGRDPQWAPLTIGATAAPSSAASGVALADSLRTLLHVSLRENAAHRTSRLNVDTVDLTATYTATIDGNAVARNSGVAGDASLNDILNGLATDINADGSVNGIVTALAVNADDVADAVAATQLRLRGDGEVDYSIDFAGDGTSVVSSSTDLSELSSQLWWFAGAAPGITPPQQWAAPAEQIQIGRRGFVQRYDTAGLARLHVQVGDLRGHPSDGATVTYRAPDIQIGPCVAETT